MEHQRIYLNNPDMIRKPHKVIAVLLLIASGYMFLKNTIFLITYNSHQGYEEGVFGYPTPFSEVLYYALFFAISLTGSVLLLQTKKVGWFISQIVVNSAIILTVFAIVTSFSGPLDYNRVEYFLLVGLLLGLSIFMNTYPFLKAFSLKRDFSTYGVVIMGILLLSFSSLAYFLNI